MGISKQGFGGCHREIEGGFHLHGINVAPRRRGSCENKDTPRKQKLISAAVNRLLKATECVEESASGQISACVGGVFTQEKTLETKTISHVKRSERVGNQPAFAGNQETPQNGGTHQTTNNTDALTFSLNNLQARQSVTRNNIILNSQDNVFSRPSLLISENASGGVNTNSLNSLLLNLSAASVLQSQSWQDP